ADASSSKSSGGDLTRVRSTSIVAIACGVSRSWLKSFRPSQTVNRGLESTDTSVMKVGDMQTAEEVLEPPMGRPRLLIVDSQPVFRMGLRRLLEQDVEVVGEASTVEEAVAQAGRLVP